MSFSPLQRAFSVSISCLVLTIFAATWWAQNVALEVNEKACRLNFGQAQVSTTLSLQNNSSRSLGAKIRLDLIDHSGRLRYRAEGEETLKSGASLINLIFTKVEYKGIALSDENMWYRLRYVVTSKDADTVLEGTISASEITPDIFDLQVFAASQSQAGMKYHARLLTAHPITGLPVEGVKINVLAKYEANKKDQSIKVNTSTDQNGYGQITFDLPKDFAEDDDMDIKLEFTATKGNQKQTQTVSLDLLQNDTYIVTTDKNLYQPEQILHTRVLIFDAQKQARANLEMEAVIEDSEEQNVFRTKLKTSKFGVASFDWTIPDNTQLGGYKIYIGKRSPRQMWGEAQFRISRYDLPTFAVNAKPNKPYYLPGENAEVEVKADYLFGQPVTKGTVKIVRETERHWNNKTYQYEVEEGETYRGEINSSGKFTAKIELKQQHEDFEAGDRIKFEDLHFSAYVTDATTGRTEPRKFDLRLTKEPIHLYLIKDENYAPNQPINYYVNASYADGAPAQCEVKIFQVIKNDDPDKENEQRLAKTVSTNKYGIAKVIDFQRVKADDDDDDVELVLEASDSAGKTGKLESEINLDDNPKITISTDKTLYRDGEPITVEIHSSVPQARAVIEVLNEKARVFSQMIEIKDGRAFVNIPYQPELKDDISIAVYANVFDEESVDHEFVYSEHKVLYPRDHELKVEVKTSRPEYQPGESASVDLRVMSATGKPVNSVLGAVIVDTAVGERERTDNDFRGNQGYYGCFYERGNIAGITRRDFDKIDPKQPIPEGLDVAAEVLMRKQNSDRISQYNDSKINRNLNSIFLSYFNDQLRPIRDFLESEYKSKSIYPKDIPTLRNILRRINIDPEALRDPWGTAYHIGFLTIGENDQMALLCAGADKKFDTYDDFIALDISRLYFRFTGEAITRAVASHQARTGDYIRNAAALKDELKRAGIDFDSLRDAWGTPYFISFRQDGNLFRMVVKSAGKDQKLAPEKSYSSDDVQVWNAPIDYISDLQNRVNIALEKYKKETKKFPGDVTTFNDALQRSGIDLDAQRDPLGHKYYARVSSQFIYSSRTEIIDYAKAGEKPQSKTNIIPITQTYISFAIRGVGEDDIQGTQDDYEVTTFARVIAEQDSQSATPEKKAEIVSVTSRKENSSPSLSPGISGSLSGIVTDASGAIIPNALVTVSNVGADLKYSANTNNEGVYFISGIMPGVFRVRVDFAGFKSSVTDGVTILSAVISKLDFKLEVGATNDTVQISAATEQFQTESSEKSNTIFSRQISDLPLNGKNLLPLVKLNPVASQNEISTPRLREYFPETLLWQPNIETDKQGRAQLKFKLADNITTWKLSLIGSTVDGQIGTVEKDIRAFQPFFAELDPPKILTEGDEISLPVVLRNYLDKSQSVDVQFKPESWFTMLSPARKKSEVKANDSTNEIFSFKAISAINKGKQRVTAIASAASDAIEKTVNVHPDGEEIAETAAGVFNETGTLEINLPKESIAGSVRGELKIYPNLLAHVTEVIEGILQRPHGCGEQTISSTYPNVMALRLLKSSGLEKHAIEKTARKYTRDGYDRLLGYRSASGGFSYWGKGEPDLALTAYALRFLSDADEIIDVNGDVLVEAENWLFKQQRNDGHWSVNDYYKASEDTRRSTMYTAMILRSLTSGGEISKEFSINIERAFAYLEKELKPFMEPYALANYAIAAQQSGQEARAKWAIEELRKTPQLEAGGNYWALESNTPFYGWGLAGRIETTALVIKALSQSDGETGRKGDEGISKGVFWLLRNKDRYGVWLSTQATINVLEAFISLTGSDKNTAESQAEIFVNGTRATSVTLPPGNQLVSPLVVDLSKFLSVGKNKIEIKRPSNGALASVQMVETYYLPWAYSNATAAENLKSGAKRALRLAVTYDKTEVKIGEEITCKVEAERIGFSGYGMMLAEIGLPPGVDVDRATLESAVKEEGWGINHYDVLPDRVILYLWPRAGGCKFSFKFRSRYGTNALNAASILYDYYNPEARAVIAPTRFVVK